MKNEMIHKTKKPPQRAQAGFSLVEVLVGMGVLGIGLTAYMETQRKFMQGSISLQKRLQAFQVSRAVSRIHCKNTLSKTNLNGMSPKDYCDGKRDLKILDQNNKWLLSVDPNAPAPQLEAFTDDSDSPQARAIGNGWYLKATCTQFGIDVRVGLKGLEKTWVDPMLGKAPYNLDNERSGIYGANGAPGLCAAYISDTPIVDTSSTKLCADADKNLFSAGYSPERGDLCVSVTETPLYQSISSDLNDLNKILQDELGQLPALAAQATALTNWRNTTFNKRLGDPTAADYTSTRGNIQYYACPNGTGGNFNTTADQVKNASSYSYPMWFQCLNRFVDANVKFSQNQSGYDTFSCENKVVNGLYICDNHGRANGCPDYTYLRQGFTSEGYVKGCENKGLILGTLYNENGKAASYSGPIGTWARQHISFGAGDPAGSTPIFHFSAGTSTIYYGGGQANGYIWFNPP